MRLGIFAKTFPGAEPGPVLAAVRNAGFEAAQYNLACSGLPSMPDRIPPATAQAVRAAAKQAGVALPAVSGTYNMAHPDPTIRAQGLARLGAIMEACPDMGTGLVTLCTGTRDAHDQWRFHPDNASPEAWAVMRAEMEKAAELAERFGLQLGIEPELANIVDSAEKAKRLIEDVGSPSLKIVLDPANLFEQATLTEQHRIVAEAVDLLADRIVMGHAKDRAADGSFVAAGRGVLDYPHYIACLRKNGFSGDLVSHGLTAEEAPAVAAFLRGLF